MFYLTFNICQISLLQIIIFFIRVIDSIMKNPEIPNEYKLKQEIDRFLNSNNRQFWEGSIDPLKDLWQRVIVKVIILTNNAF